MPTSNLFNEYAFEWDISKRTLCMLSSQPYTLPYCDSILEKMPELLILFIYLIIGYTNYIIFIYEINQRE